ncbi:3-hydroxyisobutyrate dehydrogenase, mitochondrial [Zancudomyces culisetae]|uniref:3-hydroxyisobutyrate dehydrogenase n=1 Tax=Zancudomyces culisetae TaxID=1213189 RepID=A0A1R1PKS7_ZANCU|nr:3-hydroxyisobutyrate dehydrogenase, mitochondrial [Zancudomyces culisetae]|eukprot:OMH81570.1 3-hydroxyisobutyrate dehydrogenase, mitochondrial [Zancudomyces culisetae]
MFKKTENPMVIYDINKEATGRFLKQTNNSNRVKEAASLSKLSEECEVIITMLPEPQHVKAAYSEIVSGLEKKGGRRTLCIDSSTIDTFTSQQVSKQVEDVGAKGKGGAMIPIDAPVSGGIMGAEAATLTFMVGSRNEEEFELAKEVLQHMGKNVLRCGGLGSGQTVKICNNMLLGATMVATSEAMNLGVKLGVDRKLLAKIINVSSGRCWSSEVGNPCPNSIEGANVPSNREYSGGFATKLMLKDMNLSLLAAKKAGCTTIMSALATQMYLHGCSENNGLASKDFSSVYKIISGEK